MNSDYLRKMFPGLDSVPTMSSLYTPVTPAIPQGTKMPFDLLLDYKTQPCERVDCPHFPRTTVANNQYLEDELKCHGYHHVKDQRRKAIKNLENFTGEFEYQANYFKDGKCPLPKDRYSQNFFESLYHPLYYKQFACKREHCDKSIYCPYFHSEREKVEWEVIFEQKLKVNRKVFLSTKTRQVQTPESSKVANSNQSSQNCSSDECDTASTTSRSPYSNMESFSKSRGAAYEDEQPRYMKNNFQGTRMFNTQNFSPDFYNQFAYSGNVGGRNMSPAYFEPTRTRLF